MSKNPSLSFIRLDTHNWPQYKESIMLSEQIFDESLRTEEEEYADMVSDPQSVSIIALMENEYAGSAITKRLKLEDLEDLHLEPQVLNTSSLYLNNFVVDEKWQGKGIGLAMMQNLVKRLKEVNIQHLNGHFRPNGSLAAMLKLGGMIVKEEPNWFDTGETYSYCELRIG